MEGIDSISKALPGPPARGWHFCDWRVLQISPCDFSLRRRLTSIFGFVIQDGTIFTLPGGSQPISGSQGYARTLGWFLSSVVCVHAEWREMIAIDAAWKALRTFHLMSFKVRMVTDDSQLVRILTRREIGNTGRHGCAWVCNSSLFVPQLEGRANGFMLLSLTCFDSLDSLVALCQPVTESCACYSMILTVSQDNLKWPQRLIRMESPLTHQDRRETCSSCTTKGPLNMVCPNVSKCLKAKRNSLEKSQSLRIHIAISPSTGTKVWKSQMQNLQQWRSQDPLSQASFRHAAVGDVPWPFWCDGYWV